MEDSKREDARPRTYVPKILLFSLILITIGISFAVYQIERKQNEALFSSLKEQISRAIDTRFRFYENTLLQTKAFFMQNNDIDLDDFQVYVTNIGLVNRFPGMTAIGYAEYVPAQELEKFIQDRKAGGMIDYDVWPHDTVEKKFYTPVKFVEPFLSIVRDLRGFDLVSDPDRKKAMLESAAEGKSTITEELRLFLDVKGGPPKGFNIFVPVYNSRTEPRTQALRIQKTQGYVFGIFSAEHLFNIILQEHDFFDKQAVFEVFLQEDRGLRRVYSSEGVFSANNHTSLFKDDARFTMSNKEWVIKVRSLPAFEDTISNNFWWVILSSGMTISFLIYFFLSGSQRKRADLQQRKEEYQKLARTKHLLMEARRSTGSSLDTTTLLKDFAAYFTENFCDCCLIEVAEGPAKDSLHVIAESSRTNEQNVCEDLRLRYLRATHLTQFVHREQNYLYQKSSRDLGNNTSIAFPIKVKGSAFGVITLLFLGQKNLETEEIDLLHQTIESASASIESSLLYREAETTSRVKDEFLATISHELRTPLMVILGYSRLLLKKVKEKDQRQSLEAIHQAAENQSLLIEDLLDISSIVSGRIKFRPRAVSMVTVAQETIDNLSLSLQAKNIELTFKECQECQVLGEKIRLQQVIWNLLSNSIKFTPPGGKIEVKLKKINNFCEVSVIDTGRGIEQEFLPNVFDKFRQEERSSTRSKGGLGLGLSIVKSLVELHGGSISVFSEGKDLGTIFTLKLPVLTQHSPIVEHEKEEAEFHSLSKIKVLVVEDNPEALNIINRVLVSYDAEVFCAFGVEEAFNVLSKKNPDAVISDIAMPEKSGLDFIQEIREKEKGTSDHLPAIALSAFAGEEIKKDALSKGFDDYLTKPVDPDHLAEVLLRVLKETSMGPGASRH